MKLLQLINSPFKRPKLKWYFGKIVIGTPYFLPRRFVNPTHEMVMEAAMAEIADAEDWNNKNPNSTLKRTVRPLDEVYEEKLRHQFAIPKKIGFDLVGLGWKTKWDDTDYRFEWAPLASFVFFKWQLAVIVSAPEPPRFWEAWLYYCRNTKGTKRERIEQCKKEFSLDYIVSKWGEKREVNYYDLILKDKYK